MTKLGNAGAKGVASFVTAKTAEPKRSLLLQVLGEMERERAIFVDHSKTKPKYFAIEFAPSVERAAEKIEQLAARRHPSLLGSPELKKALTGSEAPLFPQALRYLEESRELVRLIRGKATIYAHGGSLRTILGNETAISSEKVRAAYRELVHLKGFPEVEITTLQHRSGVPLESLKEWLMAEYRAGRANFSMGDWSLSDEATRAGLITIGGTNYLQVKLEGLL